MRIIGGRHQRREAPVRGSTHLPYSMLVSSRRGACPKRSLTGSSTTTGTRVMPCCLSYSLILLQQLTTESGTTLTISLSRKAGRDRGVT